MKRTIGLDPLTINEVRGLDAGVDIAARASFDAVGLHGDKIDEYLRDGHEFAEIRELTLNRNLALSDVGTVAGRGGIARPPATRRLAADRNRTSEDLQGTTEGLLRKTVAVGCEIVAAVCEIDAAEELNRVAADFRELCTSAEQHGLKVALEYVRFGRQIGNIEVAYRIMVDDAVDNRGLLFDASHFYRSRGRLVDILEIDGARIFIVHLSDVMDKPTEASDDEGRLHPCPANVDLAGFIANLDRIGYAGIYSLEILNQDNGAQDPLIVARTAKQYADRLFESLE